MKLNAAASVWLMMETPSTPMHVGALAIFRKPRNASVDYVSELAEQLRKCDELVAPWNCRLAGRRSVVPRLVEDTGVELGFHIRHGALPESGGERELGRMVSRLHSNSLDLTRPLWEFHLIEGLRGHFAFYCKVHHALLEDVNAIPIMMAQLVGNPRQRNMQPFWTQPIPGVENAAGGFVNLAAMKSLGKASAGLLRGAVSRGLSGGFAIPAQVPHSTLNRRIGQQRRFTAQQYDRQRIEALALATDSTLNEVLAYLYGSTLRRFFKEYNSLPDESLVGFIPTSLQGRGLQVPSHVIAGFRVALGTEIGDPLERLKAIKRSIAQMRADRESLPEGSVVPYIMLRSVPLIASQMPGIGRLVPPLFNLAVSGTVCTETPQYFNGARLSGVYPVQQLMQYNALSIDSVSYAGKINIGLTGARDTLPHLQRLAVYLGKALDELEEIVAAGEDMT